MEQEIKNGTYTIPEGFAAKIEDGKIVVEKAESEDERIRKEIMDFIYWAIDRGSITNEQRERSDSWLAYLERQKEQKSTVNIDNFKSFMMQYLQDAANRKTDGEIEADIDKWAKKLLNLIEVKEQKPAEWSEDYREEDLRTRFAFYTYKNEEDDGVLYLSNVFVEETSRNKGFGTKILLAAEKVAETIGAITIRLKVKQDSPANAWYRKHGYGYMAFEDGYDWLEKTLEYLKPAKQEWSEEDERRNNEKEIIL